MVLSGTDPLDSPHVAKAVDQALSFIGTRAFSASDATGQLRWAYDAASKVTTVYGGTDADAAAEFTIRLTGVNSLVATDLLL